MSGGVAGGDGKCGERVTGLLVRAIRSLEILWVKNFHRPDDLTNSVKALKETSWSSRSGLNHTRTTPPCYNNTTLGNCLYAQRKSPNVTNPICLTCKNCSYKCAADCEHCHTIQHRAVLIIFPLNLQTITITRMLSSEAEGEVKLLILAVKFCQS